MTTPLNIRRLPRPRVSVVLPVYNESDVLRQLYESVSLALDEALCDGEIVFVNDGSHDSTADQLDTIANEDKRVRVLHFSRNFGHQAAVQAGLQQAQGGAIILMDSDLQDDPAAIPKFVRRWQEGYDVVYAVRYNRKENAWKRALFFGFYRVLNRLSSTRIPTDAGNFSLVDGHVVRQITAMPERDRFFPGLRSWVGYRQIGIPVERRSRHDGTPRVSTYQLFQLAKTAIFSFSRVPLGAFYGISALSLAVCAMVSSFTVYHKLVTGLAIPGWASMTIVASLFGALNSLGIGILGEYITRIYDQVRARPQYAIARKVNCQDEQTQSSENDLLNTISCLSELTEIASNRQSRSPSIVRS